MTPPNTSRAFGDLPVDVSRTNIRVILVEPGDARNIGAVARAMSNLDVKTLRLVSPGRFDRTIAKGVACWGSDILEQMTVFDSLQEAVADSHEVVGFASDSSEHRSSQLLLEDWVNSLPPERDYAISLVFGSEENGLSRSHFPLCQHLIRIPSATDNPSFNLAQSVLLAVYALRKPDITTLSSAHHEWPTSSQLAGLSEMVLRVADRVGFLNENSPPHMRDLLLNLSRRGRVTARELKILTGLFGMVSKALAREEK